MNADINIREVTSQGSWSIARGSIGNLPAFVRFNRELAAYMGHPDVAGFTSLVDICIRLNSPTDSGLPQETELQELDFIENYINQTLAPTKRYVPAAVVTTDGNRRFLYYSNDPVAATSFLSDLRHKISTHQFTASVADDPRWAAFLSLMPSQDADPKSIEEFWKWFESKESELSNLHDLHSPLISQLGDKLKLINEGLNFELSLRPIQEVIISADGDRSLFSLVEQVVEAAPALQHWKPTAFRQRTDPIILADAGIQGEQTELAASAVRFAMRRDGDLANLSLFLPAGSTRPELEDLALVLVQLAIGEYDLVARIGEIEFLPCEPVPMSASAPITEMASALDALFQND